MIYRVITQPRAFADINETCDYLARRYSSAAAYAWYAGCSGAIDSLAQQPHRCQLARESAKLGIELRQLLYRRRRNVHRILFTIEDDVVRILCVRHSARDELTAEDIGAVEE
jgi:plasmid stabilization system protein ParE